MLAYATDFVADQPFGTGIVEVEVSEDLTQTIGEPRTLNRARYPWQTFDPRRRMPWKTIPGIDWSRDTVPWTTIEAPIGGLVSPRGRPVYLYSGGNYTGFYGVGALVQHGDGTLEDVTRDDGHFVVRPHPEVGLYGPGHPSLLRHDGETYLLLHIRPGSPEANRQMAIAPLEWSAEGLPYCPPAER